LSAPEDRILRLQAALDGELDAQGVLEFERACAEDAQLAAEFSRLKTLDEALRRAAPIEPAPANLRARIEALAAPAKPSLRERLSAAPLRAMAASLLAGMLVGGAFSWRPVGSSQDRTLVAAFERAQIGGQSVDIASSDRHVVKPWLAGRAPLATAALDLASAGFPLAGGRVEMIGGKAVPTLVYRRREHRIDLTELPSGRDDSAVAQESLDGYHQARWSDRDRAYVAVTDLPEAELADFVNLFRAGAKEEREGAK
jgi:anti-sigma factor RsiW